MGRFVRYPPSAEPDPPDPDPKQVARDRREALKIVARPPDQSPSEPPPGGDENPWD